MTAHWRRGEETLLQTLLLSAPAMDNRTARERERGNEGCEQSLGLEKKEKDLSSFSSSSSSLLLRLSDFS